MAKDTSVRLTLTQGLVTGIRFEHPIIGVDEKGKPVLDPAGPGTKRDWTVRDASLPGFSVRVYKSKAVYQVVRKMGMRVEKGGPLRSAPIRRVVGDVRTLKLDEARRTAQLWLGKMGQGIDPVRELQTQAIADAKQAKKEKLTFGDYYKQHAEDGGGITPSSLVDRQKVIKWMENSPIWDHPIHDLNAEVVARSMQPLFAAALGVAPVWDHAKKPRAEEKGKKVTQKWGPASLGPATALKIHRHMSAAYTSFVADLGIDTPRGISPFALAKKRGGWPALKEKTAYLDLDKEEHVQWLQALYQARDHEDPAKQVMADFLLCALILGGRKREVQLLEWDHLNLPMGMGELRAENRKVKKAHWFPITPWLAEILERRRERNRQWGRDDKWVFPSEHHGKPLHTYSGLLELLKEQSGVWLTAHDMRRTAATEAAEITGSDMFVSMTLGHSKANKDVSMGYVRGRVKLLRPLFEKRERALRSHLGLEEIGEEVSPIDAMIEFLREGKEDPAQRAMLEKKVGGMLMLLNS